MAPNNRIDVLHLSTLWSHGKSSGFLMFLKLFTATGISNQIYFRICYFHITFRTAQIPETKWTGAKHGHQQPPEGTTF